MTLSNARIQDFFKGGGGGGGKGDPGLTARKQCGQVGSDIFQGVQFFPGGGGSKC